MVDVWMDKSGVRVSTAQCKERLGREASSEAFQRSLRLYPYPVLCPSAATVLHGSSLDNLGRLEELRPNVVERDGVFTQVLPTHMCDEASEMHETSPHICGCCAGKQMATSITGDLSCDSPSRGCRVQRYSPFRYASTAAYRNELIRRSQTVAEKGKNFCDVHRVLCSMHSACLDALCHDLIVPDTSSPVNSPAASRKSTVFYAGSATAEIDRDRKGKRTKANRSERDTHATGLERVRDKIVSEAKHSLCSKKSSCPGVVHTHKGHLGKDRIAQTISSRSDLHLDEHKSEYMSLIERVDDNTVLLDELIGDVGRFGNDTHHSSHLDGLSDATTAVDMCSAQLMHYSDVQSDVHSRHFNHHTEMTTTQNATHDKGHCLRYSGGSGGREERRVCTTKTAVSPHGDMDIPPAGQPNTDATGSEGAIQTGHNCEHITNGDGRMRDTLPSKSRASRLSASSSDGNNVAVTAVRVSSPYDFATSLTKMKKSDPFLSASGTRVAPHTDGRDGCLQWQILLDMRERVAGKHDNMCQLLRKHALPFTSVQLPAGDFMMNVQWDDLQGRTGETGEPRVYPDDIETKVEGASSLVGSDNQDMKLHQNSCENSNFSIPDADAASTAVEANSNRYGGLYSHLYPVIFERKTLNDLEASVKGTRYSDQRRLLNSLNNYQVVWIVEGVLSAIDKSTYSERMTSKAYKREAQRNAQPSANSPARDQTRCKRILSVCAALATRDRFNIVHTRSVDETIQFIKSYAKRVLAGMTRHSTTNYIKAHHVSDTDSHKIINYTTTDSLCDYLTTAPAHRLDKTATKTTVVPSLSVQTNKTRLEKTDDLLNRIAHLQKSFASVTAFPRMLSCIRGFTPALAMLVIYKYGSCLNLWKAIKCSGHAAFDKDMATLGVTTSHKKVLIILSEFLLSSHYE